MAPVPVTRVTEIKGTKVQHRRKEKEKETACMLPREHFNCWWVLQVTILLQLNLSFPKYLSFNFWQLSKQNVILPGLKMQKRELLLKYNDFLNPCCSWVSSITTITETFNFLWLCSDWYFSDSCRRAHFSRRYSQTWAFTRWGLSAFQTGK